MDTLHDPKIILPQHVRDYALELSQDPVRALDFMQRAGNVGKDGKIHPKFTDPNREPTMLY